MSSLVTKRKSSVQKRKQEKDTSNQLSFDIDKRVEIDDVASGSVATYLRKTGRVSQVEVAKIYKARHLYVSKLMTASVVAKKLGINAGIMERWIITFGWEEERDRKAFQQFRIAQKLRGRFNQNLNQRHDRIFATIESELEDVLQDARDAEKRLSLAELKEIANVLNMTMTARRSIYAQQLAKEGANSAKFTLTATAEIPENLGSAVGALANIFGNAGGNANLQTKEQVKPAAVTLLPDIQNSDGIDYNSQSSHHGEIKDLELEEVDYLDDSKDE